MNTLLTILLVLFGLKLLINVGEGVGAFIEWRRGGDRTLSFLPVEILLIPAAVVASAVSGAEGLASWPVLLIAMPTAMLVSYALWFGAMWLGRRTPAGGSG